MKTAASFIAAMILAPVAFGAPLTPDESLSRALTAPLPGMQRSPAQYTLVETRAAETDAATAAYYVFNSPSGFLITAGQSEMPALLGRGTGTFDPGSLPCNVAMWLDSYAHAVGTTPAKAPASRRNIASICTARWNQSSPFNGACPGEGRNRAMAGCVAVAMGQIMKAHNHPAKGCGSYSYTYNNITHEVDFSAQTYDWNNILPDYLSVLATGTQKDEVAKLIYHAGVSVGMMYGATYSGATDGMVPFALTKYFGYDSDAITMLYRDNYPYAEWEQLIYSELEAGRPVYYGGRTPNGGHAFVCDGYSASDGLFHINWGWGGMYDGYFALTALEPSGQGAGGFEGGYNLQQLAVIGITPAKSAGGIYYQLAAYGNFSFDGENFSIADFINNQATDDVSVQFGIECTPVGNTDAKPSYFFDPKASTIPGWTGTSFQTIREPKWSCRPTRLAQGNYIVRPAIKISNMGERRLPMFRGSVTALSLTVDPKGNLLWTPLPVNAGTDLAIDAVTPAADASSYTIALRNLGDAEFTDHIVAEWIDDNLNVHGKTLYIPVTISASGSAEMTVDAPADLSGRFHLQLRYPDETQLKGSPWTVVSGANNGSPVALRALTLDGIAYADEAPAFALTLENIGSAAYTSAVTLSIYGKQSAPVASFSINPSIAPGEKADFTATVDKALGSGGYRAVVTDASGMIVLPAAYTFNVVDKPSLTLAANDGEVVSTTPATLTFEISNTGSHTYDGLLRTWLTTLDGVTVAGFESTKTIASGRSLRTVFTGLNLDVDSYLCHVSDFTGNEIANSPLQFATDAGIDAIDTVNASPVTIVAANGEITVTGAPTGTLVTLSDLAGRLLYSAPAAARTTAITTTARGFMILQVGDDSFKLSL